MKMKTRLLHRLLLPFLMAVACDDAAPVPASVEDGWTRLPIRIRDASAEDLQVLSFDQRGPMAIDGYGRIDPAFDGFRIGTGDRIVAAVLNGPDLSAIADFSSLAAWHYIPGETDSPDGQPLLFGYEEKRIDADTRIIELDVHRQIGRIAVLRLYNRLGGGQDIEGLCLFLANAAEDTLLGSDCLESAVRIHPDGHAGTAAGEDTAYLTRPFVDGTLVPATHGDWTAVTLGPLPHGSAHSGPYYLYSCPTPADWEPWLVIAAQISGRTWYYNLPLRAIAKDESQEVTVSLLTLGADQPCVENEPDDFLCSRSLTGWTAVNCDETI